MENENRYIQTYIIFLKLVYLYLFLQKNSSTWDERDAAYSPVDCSETGGTPYDLLEVFIIQKGRRNEWSYDARGNRIDSTVDNNSLVIEYYENSDLLKKYGEWYFNYDANGNMIARGKNGTKKIAAASNELFEGYVFSSDTGELWTYEYDLSNRLVKVNYSGCGTNGLKEKAEYLYDYRGLCIAKTSGNETEYHEYTADGRLIYTENSDHTIEYIYSGTSIFAEVRKQNGNDETFYHHTDHLGTTEVITDESGTVVWKASYEAFGSVLCENGTRVFEASFTGKFFDKDIGLYYFNARWYNAETGKFVTSDPIRDGVNWWNYCNSSPLTFIDSTGLRGKDISTNSYSEERVEKLMKKYNSFVKKARKVGYDQSANLLEHYLQGSGSTYFINSDWLQQYSQVTDAVTINIGRYEKQFKDIAENLYPGEVMQLNELPFIGKEQIGPFGKSDYSGFSSMQNAGVRGRLRGIGNDLYYTTGTFTITTFCDVTLSKNLEGEVSVVGKMTHIFWDKYDWHDNLSVYIPTVGKVKDSDAKYLEKYGPAQSFKMKSQWSLDYEKKF